MNVFLTTMSLDPERGGGTAERTRWLARHLMLMGHQCTVVAIEGGSLFEELQNHGATVYVSGYVGRRYKVPKINFIRLYHLIRDADVLHLLGYWNLLSVCSSFMAVQLGKPFMLSAAGEFVGLNQPTVLKAAFHGIFGLRMLRRSQVVVAVTELERDQIVDRFNWLKGKVIVVPNGVSLYSEFEEASNDEEFSNDTALPQSPFVIYLGRLAPVKGPDLLLEAFELICKENRSVSLVIAGPDFGMATELRAHVKRQNLSDRVVFISYLNERERTLAFRRAEFLVVPSRSEAMSLVALEAGIVGVPVLLTDQCGFNAVEEAGGGVIVDASVEGLRKGLEYMLAPTTDLEGMGKRLEFFVRANYLWRAVVTLLVVQMQKMIE